MKTIHIRDATPNDAEGIARVRIETWHSAYRGLMPDAILDDVSYELESERWRKGLEDRSTARFVLTGLFRGEIAGFCVGGAERDQDSEFPGEIYAIYVLPEYQKTGLGKALWKSGISRLIGKGYAAFLVWTLRDNQAARGFYEHMGGTLVRSRIKNIRGEMLPEVGYGFRFDDAV